MFLRLELFVDDLEASLAFYTGALGFEEDHRSPGYAAIRNGSVLLGLGLASGLPASHYFAPDALRRERGIGVEIVLEVDDLQACYERAAAARARVVSPIRAQPWRAMDFRLADPDGYYIRVTSSSGP